VMLKAMGFTVRCDTADGAVWTNMFLIFEQFMADPDRTPEQELVLIAKGVFLMNVKGSKLHLLQQQSTKGGAGGVSGWTVEVVTFVLDVATRVPCPVSELEFRCCMIHVSAPCPALALQRGAEGRE